jgi:hypothetical protein
VSEPGAGLRQGSLHSTPSLSFLVHPSGYCLLLYTGAHAGTLQAVCMVLIEPPALL